MNHVTVDVGQTHVSTAETEGRASVVDSHQVQHGCVQVVHLCPILDSPIASRVSRAINESRFYAASSNEAFVCNCIAPSMEKSQQLSLSESHISASKPISHWNNSRPWPATGTRTASTVFKWETGETPGAYRRKIRTPGNSN